MNQVSVRQLLIKNALANLLGGAGSALFNLILPALVIKHLGQIEFSVWSLALQVVLYLQLFGFGLQNVITRFIAHGNELNDLADQQKTIKASLILVTGFVAFAVLIVAGLVWAYPLFFPQLPTNMLVTFRSAITILGLSAAWQLYALIPTGVFIGLHRNIIAISGQLVIRICSVLALWWALSQGVHLLAAVLVLAVCGALLVPVNILAMYRWANHLVVHLGTFDLPRFRQLLHAWGGITVWNTAMLFVNGIDLVVVGHFDFQKVSAYSLAITAVTILIGILQAVLSPLIAIGAKMYANPDTRQNMPALLIRSTQYSMLMMGAALIGLLMFGQWAIGLWVPVVYVHDVNMLLMVLLAANVIRNSAAPYAMLLVATGLQKYVLSPAILEAAVNLIASLLLVQRYGAVGVALGTLVGGIVGVCANFWISFSRTRELVPCTTNYILRGLLLPLMPIVIICALVGVSR